VWRQVVKGVVVTNFTSGYLSYEARSCALSCHGYESSAYLQQTSALQAIFKQVWLYLLGTARQRLSPQLFTFQNSLLNNINATYEVAGTV